MGGCSTRPEVVAARNSSYEWFNKASAYTSEKYNASKEYLGPKMSQAGEDYGPQIQKAKVNYDIARMYANGWINESIADSSQIKFITEFETDLPLRNMSLNEYERRLKKLVTPAMNDMVPVRVIVECFKDHWAFIDIVEEESLTRELMFDVLFLEEMGEEEAESTALEDRKASVPMLMLLGLLYCRSNRRQRAEKFYELVEIQLTDSLSAQDPEFRAYVPFLYEISYKLMFRLYARHRDQTPGEPGQPMRCPEVDIEQYTPTEWDTDDSLKKRFTKVFVDDLFQAKSMMKRKDMEDKMALKIFYLVQPHWIRLKAFDVFVQSEGR